MFKSLPWLIRAASRDIGLGEAELCRHPQFTELMSRIGWFMRWMMGV